VVHPRRTCHCPRSRGAHGSSGHPRFPLRYLSSVSAGSGFAPKPTFRERVRRDERRCPTLDKYRRAHDEFGESNRRAAAEATNRTNLFGQDHVATTAAMPPQRVHADEMHESDDREPSAAHIGTTQDSCVNRTGTVSSTRRAPGRERDVAVGSMRPRFTYHRLNRVVARQRRQPARKTRAERPRGA
jgi:hypothetical protein